MVDKGSRNSCSNIPEYIVHSSRKIMVHDKIKKGHNLTNPDVVQYKMNYAFMNYHSADKIISETSYLQMGFLLLKIRHRSLNGSQFISVAT